MKREKLIGLVAAFVLGAGCWSMGPATTGSKSTDQTLSNNTSTSIIPVPQVSATPSSNIKMTDTSSDTAFFRSIPSDFVQPQDDAGRLLLREYGSVFVARGGALPPKKIVFKDEADVQSFQSGLAKSTENIGGFQMELQTPAMKALMEAIGEAKENNLTITPRDTDSARRSYDETVGLWASRVDPALAYWLGKGKITQSDADRMKSLTPYQQVPEILRLEAQGIYFAKDMSKSIIYSVAPPGTSQHLSMLAFDVAENENQRIRAILAKHGWYQTVTSDLPHFTFLGSGESELENLGLKRVKRDSRTFWIPKI